jgi:hypothetical protein
LIPFADAPANLTKLFIVTYVFRALLSRSSEAKGFY